MQNNYLKKYHCNKLYNNSCNNICKYNKFNNCCNTPLSSLFEVEDFLCNFNKICKGVKLYKFFKNLY